MTMWPRRRPARGWRSSSPLDLGVAGFAGFPAAGGHQGFELVEQFAIAVADGFHQVGHQRRQGTFAALQGVADRLTGTRRCELRATEAWLIAEGAPLLLAIQQSLAVEAV